MPKLGPIKHKQLIRNLRQLGFDGPYRRGKLSSHAIMVKGTHSFTIPNKHGSGEIGIELLKKVLKQAGIKIEIWEQL